MLRNCERELNNKATTIFIGNEENVNCSSPNGSLICPYHNLAKAFSETERNFQNDVSIFKITFVLLSK